MPSLTKPKQAMAARSDHNALFSKEDILFARLIPAKHDLFAGIIQLKRGIFAKYNPENSILFARLIQQIATYLSN